MLYTEKPTICRCSISIWTARLSFPVNLGMPRRSLKLYLQVSQISRQSSPAYGGAWSREEITSQVAKKTLDALKHVVIPLAKQCTL
eukprot:2713136-Amphidinium_carterae.1